jgi:hypothetical protein
MQNQATGSNLLWTDSITASWLTGSSVLLIAGRMRREMDARLPIHVTVARKWNQKIIARTQEGIDGMG